MPTLLMSDADTLVLPVLKRDLGSWKESEVSSPKSTPYPVVGTLSAETSVMVSEYEVRLTVNTPLSGSSIRAPKVSKF